LLLRPGFPEALWVVGNLDAVDGNFTLAIARFHQAITVAPDYLAARNSLANALLATGQTDEAITQYRQILRQRPDDRSVQESLARALELQQSVRPRP
jgi:predicted Zn-dependent protease